MTKSIETLKEDLEHVVATGEGWTPEISEWVAEDVRKNLDRQLKPRDPNRKGTLRLSNLGEDCDRKSWLEVNAITKPEPLKPSTLNKFIFGDMVESYLLGLVMASGHKLEGMQDELRVEGIKGHRDCVIDGMTFDVKSASSYSFDKFKHHQLMGYTKTNRQREEVYIPAHEADAFGYISQLSSYVYAAKDDPKVTYKDYGGFLAFDKQHGHIAVDIYDLSDQLEDKAREAEHKKAVVKSNKPPEVPYEPVDDGKSGNLKLGLKCSYCHWKHVCWPELRTFVYSNGPRYLTKVVKEPGALEVTE